MGDTHSVRFEPVGIEIEVDEDETVLNGAFRQGIMLMHGCKEGQCASCKSFLLDGEVDLDRYSTFALPDFEEAEGWTLLCRAHALTDLEVELVHYDEDALRSGRPVRELPAEVVAVEKLTSDIRRLVLRVDADGDPFAYTPGQYVDVHIPDGDGATRSFSMANLPGEEGELELMIKLYEGGAFSGLLADGSIAVGDTLTVTGPYGVFTLRESSPRRLVFIGGGAGMAPILALLRALREAGSVRPVVYYYGARGEADLFALAELDQLEGDLPDFRLVPALSEQEWDGETGLITDVLERCEPELAECDAYVCGPPPMVEAAIALLERRGVPENRIYFDKFTTSAQ